MKRKQCKKDEWEASEQLAKARAFSCYLARLALEETRSKAAGAASPAGPEHSTRAKRRRRKGSGKQQSTRFSPANSPNISRRAMAVRKRRETRSGEECDSSPTLSRQGPARLPEPIEAAEPSEPPSFPPFAGQIRLGGGGLLCSRSGGA